MDKDYYYTEAEWNKSVGYGSVPPARQAPTASEQNWNGEQRLNKSTGEVEVYYNGDWCAK